MTRLSFALVDNDGELELLREIEEGLEELKQEIEEDAKSEKKGFRVLEEAARLFHIAIPSVAIQFSMLIIFPMAASFVGRTRGTEELAGFSLGSLVGNLTSLSVMVGALSAADTLMPRAYGSEQYDELGRLAIRSFVVCVGLLIPPVVPLCTIMDWALVQLGQDPVASSLAASWIRVYLLGAPANLIFRVIQRFLVAQHQPWPPVYASVIPAFFLNPILLHTLVPAFGFTGSAYAIVITQWAMLFLLLLYLHLKPDYHPESWPGLKLSYLKEALQPRPLLRFLNLSLGGVLSLSEWWFWEANCFIAGSFGLVALCAHTIAYNLIPLLFMIPLGISIGLTVRMGSVIAYDAERAKLMANWTMLFTATLGAAISFSLHFFQLPIIRLFTKDDDVILESQAIWPKLSYYVFILYIFGINGAILRALGLQWRMAAIVGLSLWAFTLPAVLWSAVRNGGGLEALWSVLPMCYTLMQVLLVLSYATVDWQKRSKSIREGLHLSILEAKGDALPDEATPLVSPKKV